MKILVTGTAGFIGFHVTRKLVEQGHEVVGIDNINDYYDPKLKFARLEQLGIDPSCAAKKLKHCISDKWDGRLGFIRMDIEDRKALPALFAEHQFDLVCHLAAQAGVRYSLEAPETYIDSNIVGFLNVLECCRHYNIKHLVYASSSSVYGLNSKIPFETSDPVDHPASLYAATKKSNELMAHTYSHLFKFPTTGLRFFTVYGPWGRPDMALYLFVDAIVHNRPIKVFNFGEMERDFTYVDDICSGVLKILESDYEKRKSENSLYKIYNIGNNKSVKLTDFIREIESNLGKEAQKALLPMQPGDVERTWANVNDLIMDYGYSPHTPIEEGIRSFVQWYLEYHAIKN